MVWDSGVKKGLEFRVIVRLAKSEGVLLISMLASEILADVTNPVCLFVAQGATVRFNDTSMSVPL